MKNRKGFTLIVVMVIVVVLGLATAFALPAYLEHVKKDIASKIFKEGKGSLTENEKGIYSGYEARIDMYVRRMVEGMLAEEMRILLVLEDTAVEHYRKKGSMPVYRDISYTLHENLAKNGLAEAFRNSKSIFLVPNDPPVYMALGNIDILEDADESFAKIIEDLGTAAQESSSEYVFTTYAIYKEQHVILTVLLLAWVYPFAEGGETDFRITSFIIVR